MFRMDALINCAFSLWLSQEKINIALETKRSNFTYCEYEDLKHGNFHIGMYNKVTQDVLWADARPVIALKMLGMFAFVTPIATLVRLGGHLVKLVYTPLKIFFSAIQGFVAALKKGEFQKAFYDRLLVDLIVVLVKEVVTRPLKILRVIAYLVPMEAAAFVAFTISPDKGKRLYSLLETTLNYDEKREDLPKDIEGAIELFNEKEVFWLAPCPHPWANIQNDTFIDPDDQSVKSRYEIRASSNELRDFPYKNPCKNAPSYFCLPLLPCYD